MFVLTFYQDIYLSFLFLFRLVTLLLSDFTSRTSLRLFLQILFLSSSRPLKNQDIHRSKNYSRSTIVHANSCQQGNKVNIKGIYNFKRQMNRPKYAIVKTTDSKADLSSISSSSKGFECRLCVIQAPSIRTRIFFNPLFFLSFGESGIRIRNFFNPLSRMEIFEYTMNQQSCGH